jgi:superfamily II DNA or RNA helicase
VDDLNPFFLGSERLLLGTWQAFERDVARLMLFTGFQDVRVIGGTGDMGGDILGIKDGKLWVIQCKFTSNSSPSRDSIQEVISAGKVYKADKLAIACSRTPSESFMLDVGHRANHGTKITILQPSSFLELSKRVPEYALSRKTLRVYQEDASDKMREGLLDTGKAQIVLATGLGKTLVMAEMAADMLRDNLIKNNRILVLAHTVDLVKQLHSSFWHQLPKWISTHQFAGGEKPAYWDGITFATIQSVISGIENMPEFGMVLVDEAHHVGADKFRNVISRLKPQFLGGVTATPWRGDGFDIDVIFGPSLVRLGISEGLSLGFLSEVDYRMLADDLDWEVVQRKSKNRYSVSQLNRKLLIPTRDEEAARIILKVFRTEGRKSLIVYSPTIVHAEGFAGILRKYSLKAEAISSNQDPRTRELVMARFRGGDLDAVVNVDLFNEGVDVPDVDMIAFLRATHSRRIFVQQLGRGLRLSSEKDKVIVLDFVSDLRRIAEVIELDKATRSGAVEKLGLGSSIIQFRDESAGTFMREWMLDQASLFLREDDPKLEIPKFEFPEPPINGGIQ